jgi:hypothetical protein
MVFIVNLQITRLNRRFGQPLHPIKPSHVQATPGFTNVTEI